MDQAVLRDDGLTVYEITAGCICCQLGVDLVKTLELLVEQERPQTVIVEASGVATPDGVLDALSYYRGPAFAGIAQRRRARPDSPRGAPGRDDAARREPGRRRGRTRHHQGGRGDRDRNWSWRGEVVERLNRRCARAPGLRSGRGRAASARPSTAQRREPRGDGARRAGAVHGLDPTHGAAQRSPSPAGSRGGLLEDIARRCDEAGCSVIGHIKCHARAAESSLLVQPHDTTLGAACRGADRRP